MSVSSEIIENVKQVRTATYGKNVREAIARSLELCYGYTSGETAIEAAERANAAAAAVEAITDESREALQELSTAVSQVDDIVKVSETPPTEELNKIWIQPQGDTEYKVATYAAYEYLWDQMVDMHNTYAQGHGGIVSIEKDENYDPPEENIYERRYIINYSDETTGEIFINDGQKGDTGPLDQIASTDIFYYKVSSSNFSPTPPSSGWVSNLPTLNSGDYLWTQTRITYTSGAQAYIYGISKMGLNGRDGEDGSGAVHSVSIGEDGASGLVGDIVIPVDDAPTQNSNNLIYSGAVYDAVQSSGIPDSAYLSGSPTADTPSEEDSSTRLATTAFVHGITSDLVLKSYAVEMNTTSVTLLDEGITENTYCMFTGINPGDFKAPLNWETTSGQLAITTSIAPEAPRTFVVVLANTTQMSDND